MELTRHATVRKQQRGFQADDIELIIDYGTPVRKPGNAIEYHMRDKDAKRLVQAAERNANKAVLVNQDGGTVITVYSVYDRRKGGR